MAGNRRHNTPSSIFDNVFDQSFDENRTDSENASRIQDNLAQFGLPSDRDRQTDLTLDIEDEIRRKRNSFRG
jgi:hypothetical protein